MSMLAGDDLSGLLRQPIPRAITAEDIDARLETVARLIEHRAGNAIYQRAWKIAAQLVRGHKTSRGYQTGDLVKLGGDQGLTISHVPAPGRNL